MHNAVSTSDVHDASTVAPSQLSDRDLAVLESTLRVQLQVSKCVRAAQVTGAVGAAALSGALSAIPSGFSIVTSQVQRQKLKRRHRTVVCELEARGLHAVVGAADAVRLGKRAYAISIATGLACCLLAFSADVLIDRAVLQVVSEVAMGYSDEFVMGALAGHVTAHLTAPVMVASQPEHQPLKTKTRSWGGFTSKWKSARLRKKAESLPPDLFGERDDVQASPPAPATPQHVEVQRSDEFALFGECLVFRFTTIVPGDEDDYHELRLDEWEEEEHVEVLFPSRVVFDGATNDALSQTQWHSLWTLEDGPVDVLDLGEDDEDYNLFGTDNRSCDPFGGDKRVEKTPPFHNYDLFGVTVDEKGHSRQGFDLFGLHDPCRHPRG